MALGMSFDAVIGRVTDKMSRLGAGNIDSNDRYKLEQFARQQGPQGNQARELLKKVNGGR